MDKYILDLFMDITKRYPYIERISFLLVKFSSKIFFLIYIIYGVFLAFYKEKIIMVYIIVPLLCLITSRLLRMAIKKQRPYEKHNYQLCYNLKRGKSYSFPSNHSSSSMVIAFACGYINIYFGAFLFFMSLLTGISRVFTGIHFFSDVIAGWCLGMLYGVVGYFILVSLHIIYA